MLRMGIGVEGSRSSSTGGEFAQANGTATAYKANIGLAVCIDGERIEYGVTVGQVDGDASVGGQNVVNGQFTTFSAEGSYNMRNGDQQLNMQAFTGGVNLGNGENGEASTENDLMAVVKALGAYIEVNLTEAGNNFGSNPSCRSSIAVFSNSSPLEMQSEYSNKVQHQNSFPIAPLRKGVCHYQ